ncbi:MAG: polysaccharide deacetylase family protein [Ignavibacteriales bacterium]|nr:polysaccharide deacetylase family protein [Ignavibacteriales bacterium]
MRLNIGILGDSPGWHILLQQEGLPHSKVNEGISPEEYSAVVVGNSIDERESESLRAYTKNGGSIICSAQMYAQLAGTNYARFFVRYLVTETDADFEQSGLIDLNRKCRVPLNANVFRNENGATTAYIGEFMGGHAAVLPFAVDELFLDHRSTQKSFYSPAKRLPFERVSSVSRGNVRKIISRSLEILHHRRSLPYAHLWYYPKSAESLCAFRVDTDRGTAEEIENLYDLAHQHRVPMTWFIDTKNQQEVFPLLRRMENQEFGIHCYSHRVFADYDQNRENIGKALEIFRLENLSARGFAAPFGTWNKGLARAVKELGFEYSSEFSYDYDNFPSQPYFDDRTTGVWQIPVHPICVGSLKRQGYNHARMIQYFEFVLRQKFAARDPLIFYHHPKDGHHGVLEHIFTYVDSHRLPSMKFHELLQWWKKRAAITLRLSIEGTHMKVEAPDGMEDVFLRISKGDGTEVFSPVRLDIPLDTLTWEPKPRNARLPADYLRCRKFNYRIPLTRIVDFLAR